MPGYHLYNPGLLLPSRGLPHLLMPPSACVKVPAVLTHHLPGVRVSSFLSLGPVTVILLLSHPQPEYSVIVMVWSLRHPG